LIFCQEVYFERKEAFLRKAQKEKPKIEGERDTQKWQ
jgi:hypothetical protein